MFNVALHSSQIQTKTHLWRSFPRSGRFLRLLVLLLLIVLFQICEAELAKVWS